MNPSGRHFPTLLALLILGNALVLGGLSAWFLWSSPENAPPPATTPETPSAKAGIPDFLQGALPNRLPRALRSLANEDLAANSSAYGYGGGVGPGFVVPLPPDKSIPLRPPVPPPTGAPSMLHRPLTAEETGGWPDQAPSTTSSPHTLASPTTRPSGAAPTNPLANLPSLNPAPSSGQSPSPRQPLRDAPSNVPGWPTESSSASTTGNAPSPAATSSPLPLPSSSSSAASFASEDSGASDVEMESEKPTPEPTPSATAKPRRSPSPQRTKATPTPRATPSATPSPSPSSEEENPMGRNRRFVPFRPR